MSDNAGPAMTEMEAMRAQALPPRLVPIGMVTYEPAIWPGSNPSGLKPYGPNLLVCMDICSTSTGGGVMLTDDMRSRMDEASNTGCVYAIGTEAFKYVADHPQVGDRICIDKFAGIKQLGQDGRLYRLVDEKCVAAMLEPMLVED